ncbi:MAG: hypothetical protein IPF62_10945 [Bacteroidetes bacterium]|nr:hypothetical protein [Bacteroidota bacterium]
MINLYAKHNVSIEDGSKIENEFILHQHEFEESNDSEIKPEQEKVNFLSMLKSNTKTRKIILGIGIGLVLLGILLKIFAKYNEYSSMGHVYSLADNISIRKSSNDKSEIIGRMDLFKHYMSIDGRVISSYNEMKVISTDTENSYCKVQMTASFWDYLTGDDDNVGYCHSSCYQESKLSDKAMLSIGQYKTKNKLGTIDKRIVIVQLDDGQYYTIQGNKNDEIDAVLRTKYTYGGQYYFMRTQGKFKFNNDSKSFIWESCNKTDRFTSRLAPFDLFVKSAGRMEKNIGTPLDRDDEGKPTRPVKNYTKSVRNEGYNENDNSTPPLPDKKLGE